MERKSDGCQERCRYASLCRFYQREGYTCNDEEAETYCATYDVFEKFRPPKIAIRA